YQYWRNVDDKDVEKCLGLLTFLPMDEVRRLGALEGSAINEAKKVLAYEVTKLVHGEEEAQKAAEAAAALFAGGASSSNVPSFELTAADLMQDSRVSTMLVKSGLCKSQTEARQQIKSNAVSVGSEKVTDQNATISAGQFGADGLMLQKGKKGFRRLILK
ncbi:MAG: S4 domain-containing protein, partial [Aristaeellaceae bacterium]